MKPNSKELVAAPKNGIDPLVDQTGEQENLELTEWLLYRLKIMYSGKVYEGDNPQEAKDIREMWRKLVINLGRNLVMKTVEYFLSGSDKVPSYPPSAVVFSKIARTYVAPNLKPQNYFLSSNVKLEKCNPEVKYKCMQEIKKALGKNIN